MVLSRVLRGGKEGSIGSACSATSRRSKLLIVYDQRVRQETGSTDGRVQEIAEQDRSACKRNLSKVGDRS